MSHIIYVCVKSVCVCVCAYRMSLLWQADESQASLRTLSATCTAINHGDAPFTVQRGERIAQLVIAAVTGAVLDEVELLPESGRGTRGFGSTGTDGTDGTGG